MPNLPLVYPDLIRFDSLGPLAVVELPPEFKIFPVFHVALVKPYEPGLPGQEILNAKADKRAEGIVLTNPGESEEDEEGEMWYFDKILNSRKVRGTLQYRIKWPHPHKPRRSAKSSNNQVNQVRP